MRATELALPAPPGPVAFIDFCLGDFEGGRVADELDVAVHRVKGLGRTEEQR